MNSAFTLSVVSVFRCHFSSFRRLGRNKLGSLNYGYGVNFVVLNWNEWWLCWEVLLCNTRKDKVNVLLFFIPFSVSWCDHVTHKCNHNICLSFQTMGLLLKSKYWSVCPKWHKAGLNETAISTPLSSELSGEAVGVGEKEKQVIPKMTRSSNVLSASFSSRNLEHVTCCSTR